MYEIRRYEFVAYNGITPMPNFTTKRPDILFILNAHKRVSVLYRLNSVRLGLASDALAQSILGKDVIVLLHEPLYQSRWY
jgi:hypothetical protein